MTLLGQNNYKSKPSMLLLKVSMNKHLRHDKKCQAHVICPPKSLSDLSSFWFRDFLSWMWFFSVCSNCHCIYLPFTYIISL